MAVAPQKMNSEKYDGVLVPAGSSGDISTERQRTKSELKHKIIDQHGP